jgi:hypothetical protein
LGGFIPGIRAGQILRPKGPSPALVWADGINNTFFLAFDFSQEYTVSVIWLFDNRCAEADAS